MSIKRQKMYNFKLLFNVKLIHSIQVLGPWLWGNRPFFLVVGQRKGPSGVNAIQSMPIVLKNALHIYVMPLGGKAPYNI
jgi:hypothetical protein